jgi:hypothetical protein
MHQDAAKRVMAVATFLVLAAVDVLRNADKFGASALVGELRRILQQQHCAMGRFKACTRRVEVPAQDVAFAHPLIGEEPIGRFGVGPILAGERNALSDPPPIRIKSSRNRLPRRKSSKTLSSISPSTQWEVSLDRSNIFVAPNDADKRNFVCGNPMAHLVPPTQVLSNESQGIQTTQENSIGATQMDSMTYG